VRRLRHLSPDTAVLFADWTILRMYPPLRQAWGWRGEQIQVRISGQNAKRVLFGAIHLRSGHRVLLRRKQAGQSDFQAFLRELRSRYGARPLALLLDKAGSHTAPASQALAAQLDICLIWLPRQRPELNGMDQLWKEMKKAISANRQYDSVDQHAEHAEDWMLCLSRTEALRKAGILSENHWLQHL
jgi:transposase